MNFENLIKEFSMPSKIKLDKSKYCSLSRKYRQMPPLIHKRFTPHDERQVDEKYGFYPSEELIKLKK